MDQSSIALDPESLARLEESRREDRSERDRDIIAEHEQVDRIVASIARDRRRSA